MDEEKLKEFKRLLKSAREEYFSMGGDKAAKELGKFILETALFDGIIVKNTTGGYTVELEV